MTPPHALETICDLPPPLRDIVLPAAADDPGRGRPDLIGMDPAAAAAAVALLPRPAIDRLVREAGMPSTPPSLLMSSFCAVLASLPRVAATPGRKRKRTDA